MARPFNRLALERLTAPKLMLVAAALAAYAGAWALLGATNDLGHDPEPGPPRTVPLGTAAPSPPSTAAAATPTTASATEGQPTPIPARRSQAS